MNEQKARFSLASRCSSARSAGLWLRRLLLSQPLQGGAAVQTGSAAGPSGGGAAAAPTQQQNGAAGPSTGGPPECVHYVDDLIQVGSVLLSETREQKLRCLRVRLVSG